jgi:hypothetical protein
MVKRSSSKVALSISGWDSKSGLVTGISSIRALLRVASQRLAVNQERLQRTEQPF